MIDTHSHLYEPEFAEDREAVLQRARQAGVERILLPNINNDSREPMLELCRLNPGYCYPMLGLHPEDVRPDFQPTLDAMRHELAQPGHPYIAVGEVGLDFYWDQTYANEQAQAFRQQVQWAVEFRLPLMIHCSPPADGGCAQRISRRKPLGRVPLLWRYDGRGHGTIVLSPLCAGCRRSGDVQEIPVARGAAPCAARPHRS